MKNILIVEDREREAAALQKLIYSLTAEVKVWTARNTVNAYGIAMEHRIQLFLIDLVLQPDKINDMKGAVFAENIRKVQGYEFVPMIFVAGLEDPKMYVYRDLHCYGYLQKPYQMKEAKKLIEQALRFPVTPSKKEYVFFKKDGVIYSVGITDIVYAMSKKGAMTIVTTQEELTLYYISCKKLLSMLQSSDFLQCSRNTVVNKRFIRYIDKTNSYIGLTEGFGSLHMGVSMKKKFMLQFMN